MHLFRSVSTRFSGKNQPQPGMDDGRPAPMALILLTLAIQSGAIIFGYFIFIQRLTILR